MGPQVEVFDLPVEIRQALSLQIEGWLILVLQIEG